MVLLIATFFSSTALAEKTEQLSIPDGTLTASIVSFDSNKTYAVYSAPDIKSIRGANNRARVSTNDWIQVFGTDGDWVLVQYGITAEHYRIGYIRKSALPEDANVPELSLVSISAIVNYDVAVTDDPLVSQTSLTQLTETPM